MKILRSGRAPIGSSRLRGNFKPVTQAEPLYAATGDNDLMSQEPRKATWRDQLNVPWVQNISAAKTAWGKLTHSELMLSEGCELKLTNLIARRYNLSSASAQQQVHRFFQQCS